MELAQDAATGDLGTSLYSGEPVAHTIRSRLPVTLSLVVSALLLTLIVGVGLGLFSAVRGGIAARFVDAFSLISYSLPVFWLSVLLVMLFAVRLGWLPAVGYVPLTESPTAWLRALALPVIALSLHGIAAIAKQTREAMLDVLASEYIRMAWVNGISARAIYFNNALKNAGIRIVTILGLQAVALLSGTVLVEVVFALPGMGSLSVNASLQHDLPVIQGVVVLFTLIVVVVNLVIDLLYTWLNPRVQTTMSDLPVLARGVGRRRRAWRQDRRGSCDGSCVAPWRSPVLRFSAPSRQLRSSRLSCSPKSRTRTPATCWRFAKGRAGTHLLGTDTLGRDVLDRLLVGTQVTLIGVAEALLVALALGVPLGLAAGYFGGRLDRAVGWLADLVFSMPGIIIILVVLSVFPKSMTAAMTTFGVIAAPGLMRVVRSAALPVREELYVAAAQVSGLSHPYIISSPRTAKDRRHRDRAGVAYCRCRAPGTDRFGVSEPHCGRACA